MAVNPLEHVNDSSDWVLFESLGGGLELHLPSFDLFGHHFHLTKFMLLELIAAALIFGIYVWPGGLARRASEGKPPKGIFWNAFESLLTFIRNDVAKQYIGEHEADKYVPFLWTMFLFVLFCNLLGMFPFGFASPTASLAVTGGLALCSFLVIHGAAIAKHGPIHYAQSYVPNTGLPFLAALPLVVLIVSIEIFGHFIRAFVLAVRLFANMLGGHTVLAVILGFIVMARNAGALFWPVTAVSVAGVVALSFLELFVAFLQAYIFVFLTALFLGGTLHPEH